MAGEWYNAMCSRCGQAIKYVFYFEGKPVGGDCFERLNGISVDVIRHAGFIDAGGNIDLDGYKQSVAERQADATAKAAAHKAEWEARCADALAVNQWLIDDHIDHAHFAHDGSAQNFFASIITSLRQGQKAEELPARAINIIVDTLTKGMRGKKRDEAQNNLYNRIYGNTPEA